MHRPPSARDAIVLTHGAGGSRDTPLLVALATAFAEAGLLALRCDLPFRQERASGPPSARAAGRDRAGLGRAAQVLRERVPGRVFLGGHSYGGRQASILLAGDPAAAAALLLLAYPLRPPRRPAESRTAHLPALSAPVLFVHGTRDPFGSLAEVDAARAIIPAPTALLPVEGAGHDLVPGRRSLAGPTALPAAIVRAFLALVGAAERAAPPRAAGDPG
jgi:predicted alpha/beta-hydrolase family hydrolase